MATLLTVIGDEFAHIENIQLHTIHHFRPLIILSTCSKKQMIKKKVVDLMTLLTDIGIVRVLSDTLIAERN